MNILWKLLHHAAPACDEPHVLALKLRAQKAGDLGCVLGAEVDRIPFLGYPGGIALNGIGQGAGGCAEALHLAALGKAAQLDQGQVGQLGEGHVTAPMSQVGSQLLQHLQDRRAQSCDSQARGAARCQAAQRL